jgi:hypothetical protein
MKTAREKGVETIINPAPAIPLQEEAYQGLGHLIVNETEASILSGIENPTSWDEVAGVFIARGVKNVIITLGGDVSSLQIFPVHILILSRASSTKRKSTSPNPKMAILCRHARSRSSIQQPLAIPSREHTPSPLHAGKPWHEERTLTLMPRLHMLTELHR